MLFLAALCCISEAKQLDKSGCISRFYWETQLRSGCKVSKRASSCIVFVLLRPEFEDYMLM